MGKTAVVTALVLAAKASPKERRPAEQGNLTVVLANNTLVGQWVDEIKKFAPGLSVVQAYGGKKLVSPLTDVVVTTPNCSPSGEMLRYCTPRRCSHGPMHNMAFQTREPRKNTVLFVQTGFVLA